MKKIILAISLLFVFGTASSQVLITLLLGDKLNSDGLEFGLEGGVNWSNISGLETNKFTSNFNLGFYFDIRIKNQWSFYTGVLVKSNLGVGDLTAADLILLQADTVTGEGKYKQKLNYFLIPALIKYKFKNRMYVEAGPQFGLMYKSWVEFNANIDGKETKIKEFNKDLINKFDVGIMAGLGMKIMKDKGWTIGVKYYYGFVDVYKNVPGTKNSSIFLKMNIPIGAGKAKKKAAEAEAEAAESEE